MSRVEFMKELERLLSDISDSEREEAIQYYTDYFGDAGAENEASIIEELVSPEQVAKIIKAGLAEGTADGTKANEVSTAGNPTAQEERKEKKGMNGWKVAFMIVLSILLFPVILPIGMAAIGIVIGIVATIISLFIAVLAIAAALLVAGIIVIVSGIIKALAFPAVGVVLAGAGCLIFAMGILAAMITVWLCTKIVPWLIKGIVDLVSYPFRKRKGSDMA